MVAEKEKLGIRIEQIETIEDGASGQFIRKGEEGEGMRPAWISWI